MTTELRIRTASLPRELVWLLNDTLEVFLRGLVSIAGWNWGTERCTGRTLLSFDFEHHDSFNWQAWGFGHTLQVSRLKP